MKITIELTIDDDVIDADYSIKDLRADIKSEVRFKSAKLNAALLEVDAVIIERGKK